MNTAENKNPAKLNAMISAAILAKIAEGMTPRAALDAVLGEGTFEQLAGELWEALRAKAAYPRCADCGAYLAQDGNGGHKAHTSPADCKRAIEVQARRREVAEEAVRGEVLAR